MLWRFYFSVVCHFPSALHGVFAITAESEYFWWEEQRRTWFCSYVLEPPRDAESNSRLSKQPHLFLFERTPLPCPLSCSLWVAFVKYLPGAPILWSAVRLTWALLSPFTNLAYKEIIFSFVLLLLYWKLNTFVTIITFWGPFQSFLPLPITFASCVGKRKLFGLHCHIHHLSGNSLGPCTNSELAHIHYWKGRYRGLWPSQNVLCPSNAWLWAVWALVGA